MVFPDVRFTREVISWQACRVMRLIGNITNGLFDLLREKEKRGQLERDRFIILLSFGKQFSDCALNSKVCCVSTD
jgi:hypothetical protein